MAVFVFYKPLKLEVIIEKFQIFFQEKSFPIDKDSIESQKLEYKFDVFGAGFSIFVPLFLYLFASYGQDLMW